VTHHAQQRGVDDISRRDSSRAGLIQDLRDVRSWHFSDVPAAHQLSLPPSAVKALAEAEAQRPKKR
jgi:hypothetical protein